MDSQYGFRISYPPGFTFKQEGVPPGRLLAYRAVDTCYLGNHPPGQVEMDVYARDADALTAWVQKHAASTCDVAPIFFWGLTNLTRTTAAGRDAATFDEVGGCYDFSGTIHTTVFFLGTTHVFSLDWWSTDPGYGPTVEAIAEKMLASFSG